MVNMDIYNAEIANIEDIIDITYSPYENPNQIVEDMINGLKNKNYEIILDRKEAIKKAITFLNKFDTLLILGKGHEEYMIIKDKKIPFKDSEVVNEIIKNNEFLVK